VGHDHQGGGAVERLTTSSGSMTRREADFPVRIIPEGNGPSHWDCWTSRASSLPTTSDLPQGFWSQWSRSWCSTCSCRSTSSAD